MAMAWGAAHPLFLGGSAPRPPSKQQHRAQTNPIAVLTCSISSCAPPASSCRPKYRLFRSPPGPSHDHQLCKGLAPPHHLLSGYRSLPSPKSLFMFICFARGAATPLHPSDQGYLGSVPLGGAVNGSAPPENQRQHTTPQQTPVSCCTGSKYPDVLTNFLTYKS